MKHFKLFLFLILATTAAMQSCITVNVNFPETAVQRATDDFVRDLYKEDEKIKADDKSSEKKKSSALINLLIPSAYAEDSLNMNTGKIKEIKGRMGARVSEIVGWKGKSVLGESFDGKITMKDDAKLSKDEKKKVQSIVEQENKDRDELYEEVQRANSITDAGQSRIRRFFGAAFRKNSPEGTWLEDENGKWLRK